ncbi:MAG: hypothetical protein UT21_C0012G0003 [Candidatus Woesebacteria bacterium GW2011_GWA1_39_11b]|nr:MAG: hypothetical protein UT21_C0012G0003 [Candidatus Woesebacteria bacterium GW2011_GWA1_39_11b]
MSKAILEFNLPEDSEDFMRAIKALDVALALFDIDQYLRNKIKYGNRNEFQEVRDAFYEIMDNHDIKLDRLIS